MNTIESERNTRRDERLFLGVCLLAACILFIDRVLQLGIWDMRLLFKSGTAAYDDMFMDLFHSIDVAGTGNPYSLAGGNAIYPPICYVFYFILRKTLPVSVLCLGEIGQSARLLRDSQSGRILVMLLTILVLLAIAYILYKKLSGKESVKVLLILCILLSAPMLFAIERANLLLLTLPMLCFYVAEYDSEHAVHRELAILALALAAALKLYPAVLGVLLLRDKKYWMAVRCAVYFILFQLFPCFFYGGLHVLQDFLLALRSFSSSVSITPDWLMAERVDLRCIVGAISTFFGYTATEGAKLGGFLTWPVSILLVLIAFLIKSRWKAALSLTLVMIAFPSFGYYYMGVFYLIPLFLFFSRREHAAGDILYVIGFAMVMMLASIPTAAISRIEALPVDYLVAQYLLSPNYLFGCIGFLYFTLVLIVDTTAGIITRMRHSCKTTVHPTNEIAVE